MTSHPVDVHVGKQLCKRRNLLGLSQKELAQSVGLTFQQIQKYEKGSNRVSSSRLHDLSKLLDVSVTYFFDGLPKTGAENRSASAVMPASFDIPSQEELQDVIDLYGAISNTKVRKRLVLLLQSLSSLSVNENDAEPEEDDDSNVA